MPRRVAIEFKCDRCGSVWVVDYDQGAEVPSTPSLEILFCVPVDGCVTERIVSYTVLCKRCVDAVTNYLKGIDIDPARRHKPRAKKGVAHGAPPVLAASPVAPVAAMPPSAAFVPPGKP